MKRLTELCKGNKQPAARFAHGSILHDITLKRCACVQLCPVVSGCVWLCPVVSDSVQLSFYRGVPAPPPLGVAAAKPLVFVK